MCGGALDRLPRTRLNSGCLVGLDLVIMDPLAVKQAQIRLERAKQALATLETKKVTPAEIQTAWSNFLLATNSVYSKLREGAKTDGKSKAWFGRVKHIRKTDELLSYIHHARNSEEHDLAGSLITKGIRFVPADSRITFTENDDGSPSNIFIPENMKKGEAVGRMMAPEMRLTSVKDGRYNDVFHPPSSHLGKPLADNSLVTIMRLAMQYLDGLVSEAAAL
jgi:hypothetical protein